MVWIVVVFDHEPTLEPGTKEPATEPETKEPATESAILVRVGPEEPSAGR